MILKTIKSGEKAGCQLNTAGLEHEYFLRKAAIRERLDDFRKMWNLPDKKIFAELCFCICTPQSRAVCCDKAIKGLERSGKLFTGTVKEIREGLSGVRFPNNKAGYIKEARDFFSSRGGIEIKKYVDLSDIGRTRDFFVENVKGIGYKEASHFLRNIGHGGGLAILDVHIIKNMVKYGILQDKPACISRACYAELEEKLKRFSKKTDIPMDELDILFWSMETGVIFK
jgi:N-glycosylase/DNA lyase